MTATRSLLVLLGCSLIAAVGGCTMLKDSFNRVMDKDTTGDRIARGSYDTVKPSARPAGGVCVHASEKSPAQVYDPEVVLQVTNYSTGAYRVTLYGCDDLAKKGQLVLRPRLRRVDPTRAEPLVVPNDYRTLKETEIAGIFLRNPQPGGDRLAEWPRVAITIVSAPDWHLDLPAREGLHEHPADHEARVKRFEQTGVYEKPTYSMSQAGCWKFKARVWSSASASHSVEPFYFCNWKEPLRTEYGLEALAYEKWAGLYEGIAPSPDGPTTGARRTEGPVAPDTPVPFTRPYQDAEFKATWTGRLIKMMTKATGMDYRYDDRRLWFNLDASIEPHG